MIKRGQKRTKVAKRRERVTKNEQREWAAYLQIYRIFGHKPYFDYRGFITDLRERREYELRKR